ncbi:hypothetical protein Syun_014735 [Stephania yunnanensis]|uniref:Phosphoribulokinase/uridine kinase domain-containing protein n=1 Tax=Stephania yunnanensis TaxID=152371 RepID=A0AAP0JM23_9MAGN
MLSERRKSGLQEMSSLVIHRTIEVPSSRILIIEGIYALSEKLRPLLDLRVSIIGGVHFDLVKRVLRDIQRADQEPEEIIQQIFETAKHQIRRRQELTQTTPDQPLDDEPVYGQGKTTVSRQDIDSEPTRAQRRVEVATISTSLSTPADRGKTRPRIASYRKEKQQATQTSSVRGRPSSDDMVEIEASNVPAGSRSSSGA